MTVKRWFQLDEALAERLKTRAAQENVPADQLLSALLSAGLTGTTPTPRPIAHAAAGGRPATSEEAKARVKPIERRGKK